MYIALLGRQPELSLAELERVFNDVSRHSTQSAIFNSSQPVDVQCLGGSQKIGRISLQLTTTDWNRISKAIIEHYSQKWHQASGKITLGISVYDAATSAREVQKIGLIIKSKLKNSGVSLRLIPNTEAALSTATSHHNKLGLSDNKIELLIIKGKALTIVAESIGAQNITALAARDQGRPRRDAFVGMLPPKLAQIMINLSGLAHAKNTPPTPPRILDPFCGTGVVLQEALLMGYNAYGTDLSEKMVRYSRDNVAWIKEKHGIHTTVTISEGDAMDARWSTPIDAVVSEAYLGQPFSAPPSPAKLAEVRGNCNHIIGSFLKNISSQIAPGTPVVLAIPAWRNQNGSFTHLPLVQKIDSYGFEPITFKTISTNTLLYFRPDQVVAREILVLVKK